MTEMKILIALQGPYGERILENIKRRGPQGWEISSVRLPGNLPPIIDEPVDVIPDHIPEGDLLIFLGESAEAAQLIPDIALSAGVKGVIAPVDHAAWLPRGLAGQVKATLDKFDIGSVFPKNFCTLTRETTGYGDSAERYENAFISAFAAYFGRPKLRVDVNPETRRIEAVQVERSSPCGSTHHAANRIIGFSADEAVPAAGLICMQFPCLASMEMEQIDKAFYNTLMHLSGQIFNDVLADQLRSYCPDGISEAGQGDSF
jgi:thymidylate synthase